MAALAMVASTLAVALAIPALAGSGGDGYISLGGNDYLTTSSFSNGSNDMDFIFYAAADDWSKGTQTIAARWPGVSTKNTVRVEFNNNGNLVFVVKDARGSNHVFSAGASALNLTNGKGYWFRVRLNAAVGGESVAKFFVANKSISAAPLKIAWGSPVRTDKDTKFKPRDTSGTWSMGAISSGRNRFKGDLGYLGFWRNGWSNNGGYATITLDFRTGKQGSNGFAKWTENGHAWNVKGSGWSYTASGTNPPPPTTSTTTTTTTVGPPENQKPTAKTDAYTVTVGDTVVITRSKLLSNDTDPENDALSVKSVAAKSAQNVSVTPNGTKWEYKAPASAAGTVDNITYVIQDTAGNTDAGKINITVEAVNNPGGYDVIINPGDNIAAIVDNKPAGTSFYIKAGKYRFQEIKPKDNMKFVGQSGAILSGAKRLTQFGQSGGLWYADNQTQGSANKPEGSQWGYCQDPAYKMCTFPEQLFVGGNLLWQVSSKTKVGPGKWYFDYGANRIWFADNPSGKTVETSVTAHAFHGNADNVHIEGLVMERYATPGRQGVVQNRIGRTGTPGKNWTVKQNIIRWSHGYGVKVQNGMDILGNHIHHMGQMGIGGAISNNLLIANNELSFDGISGFENFGFGGGALKLNGGNNITMRGNYVHHNPGHGLHLDEYITNSVYEDNIITHNEGAGINHEVSGNSIIRNNVVENNGFRSNGAKLFGIMVLTSADTEVYGNTLKGNANGIIGRQDAQGGPFELKNLWVHHNDVTLDGSARVGIATDGVNNNAYFTSKNNRFTSNDYTLDYGNPNFKPFKWINGSVGVSEWKSKGMDTNGTFNWIS